MNFLDTFFLYFWHVLPGSPTFVLNFIIMKKELKNKTAVIYARVSSVGDRQSTERQVKDLADYAKKMDIL